MRRRLTGACLFALVLAVAAAACGGSSQAPSPSSPTPAASPASLLPPVWDGDVGSGVLPGGVDGEGVFGVDAAIEPLRIEGVVAAIRGTCPNIGLRVGAHVVRTFARTAFEGQRCSAIAVRDRIVVLGRPIGDDLVGALRVATRKP